MNMWQYILAFFIGPAVVLLSQFQIIPKLEFTPIILAFGFCVLAFSAPSLLFLLQVLGLMLGIYFLASLIFCLYVPGSNLKECALISLMFTCQTALFCILLGGLVFAIQQMFQIH